MIHDCDNCKHVETPAFFEPCASCGGSSYWEPYVQTNADRIRAMTDEKLAEFLGFVAQDAFCYGRGMRERMLIYPFDTHESTLDWLKQEATE